MDEETKKKYSKVEIDRDALEQARLGATSYESLLRQYGDTPVYSDRSKKQNKRKAVRILAAVSMDMEYEMTEFENEIVAVCKKYL